MNIVMMTNTFTPHVGGVARSVEQFTAEYRRRGHHVLVVAPEFAGQPRVEQDVIRVPTIQKFNGSDFSVPVPLPGYFDESMSRFRPQVIHAHHPFLLGVAALRLAASRELPVVFTHHTQYEQYTHYVPGDSRRLRRFAIELSTGYCNLCDAVIAPSQTIAEMLVEQGVRTRLEAIPTGVIVERFAQGDGAAVRARCKIDADAPLVGHVGRLAPEKNLAFLADAVSEFLLRDRRAQLLVVGDGPSRDEIASRFTQRSLQDRLHLVGSQQGQDLVDCYHAMDVFAFASQSETQGMVLTEAFAAGVPVVAVDAPGVREVVCAGKNGRLLAQQDAGAFADALAWICTIDPSQRRRMLEEVGQTAEENSMPRSAERALALYQDLIDAGRDTRLREDDPWAYARQRLSDEWKIVQHVADAAKGALRRD